MPVLNVPLIHQPADRGECGIACLAMIYAFYGKEIGYEQLREELTLVQTGEGENGIGGGLMMPVLGQNLQQHGFETVMVTANPRLFYAADIGASTEDVGKIIAEHHTAAKSDHDRKLLEDFQAYLASGGKIEVDIPAAKHVWREIDQGNPMIVLGSTRFMHSRVRKMNFHFTVITGYDGEDICFNDPAPATEGIYQRPANWWLHGLIASSYVDLDNGSLLCIRPKG